MNGSSGYLKPSLIAGAAFGAASGIPLLNCANLACCACRLPTAPCEAVTSSDKVAPSAWTFSTTWACIRMV